jgi:hypothetical protein
MTKPRSTYEDACAVMKEVLRIGDLTMELPCLSTGYPTVNELKGLLLPYRGGSFDDELPAAEREQPLPPIGLRQVINNKLMRSRIDVHPDGSVTERLDDRKEEHDLEPTNADALRLIFRTPLCKPTKAKHASGYQVKIGDQEPVLVGDQLSSLDPQCPDYHVIALTARRALF